MVGELLERMGNRKSPLIVDAVREYLLHHPELQEGDCKIEICMTPAGMPENLEDLVRKMVEERIARYQQKESTTCQTGENLPGRGIATDETFRQHGRGYFPDAG